MTNRTEATTMTYRTLLCAAFVLAGTACQDIDTPNQAPIAVAQVLVGGQVVNTRMPIPYEGMDVEVELSGAGSSDPDGDDEIEKYEWRRTDVTGAQRRGGADAGFDGDPPARRRVTLSLGEGSYRFTLFVTDKHGAVSVPASVSFRIEELALYTPDEDCLADYDANAPNDDCAACVCANAEMGGCLDLFNNCVNNDDAMFSQLCVAVFECGIANNCLGSACYAPALCMAEIDAAATYMGGALGDCNAAGTAPEDNPCRGVSLLSQCINQPMVATPERPGCGTLCRP
jgi:hypothetical protein